MPMLSQISDGVRENPDVAFIFFEFFLPPVVGRKKFKMNADLKEISNFVTVSDEAFAVLLLENSWEKWADELVKRTNDPEKVKPPLFTKTPDSGKKFSGWSAQGIKYFNDLYDIIENDRKKDKKRPRADQVEVRYLRKKKEETVERENEKYKNKSRNNEEEEEETQAKFDPWKIG